MSDPPPATQRLHTVLLAAGASSRFGSPKQLATFQGQSLIEHAAATAASVAGGGMTIVLGAHSRQVEDQIKGVDAQVVLNTEWRNGLASSVRKGLVTLPSAAIAVLLLPCDMPLVDEPLLRDLRDQWQQDRSKIITCISERGAGLPAIVPRRYFKALMSIKGDPGINSFFARHKDCSIEIDRPEVGIDIDTGQDRDALLERLSSEARPGSGNDPYGE